MNWPMDKVQAAAGNDPVVAEAILRVQHIVDPPGRLLRPSFLVRLVAANRRPRNGHKGLTSGQVIAGEIGSAPFGYTTIGEPIDLAQRM